jgi:hypothetical protein
VTSRTTPAPAGRPPAPTGGGGTRQGFRRETWDAPDFDPATYLVAGERAPGRRVRRAGPAPAGGRLGGAQRGPVTDKPEMAERVEEASLAVHAPCIS